MPEFYPYRYKGYPAGHKPLATFPMPSERERDRRWRAIRRAMRKNHVDCLIVSAPGGYMPSATYLTYISNYVPYFNPGTYVVFPLKGEPQLGVNNRIGPQFHYHAWEQSWIRGIAASLTPAKDIVNKIKELQLKEGKIGLIGYREGVFAASVLDILRREFPGAVFDDATAVLCRAMDEVTRTSREELKFLKKGCEILDLTFHAVAERLKPGVRECDLWAAAEEAILTNGGWYAHNMYAASGPNPTFPKAPASLQRLTAGDLAVFEISAFYGGVSPQISYALSLGRPDAKIEEMFEFCRDLYFFSLAELEKKRTFLEIETALVRRMHRAGYEPMTPQIHRYNMSIITPMESLPQPGDYFTVHPNVATPDYTVAAKLGDTIRITKEGKVERLHSTPVQLKVL